MDVTNFLKIWNDLGQKENKNQNSNDDFAVKQK